MYMYRVFRTLAAAVATHGVFFALYCYLLIPWMTNYPTETSEEIFFVIFAGPALFLAAPFGEILGMLNLMETPGWYSWPSSPGFLLVYGSWILAFWLLSLVAKKTMNRVQKS